MARRRRDKAPVGWSRARSEALSRIDLRTLVNPEEIAEAERIANR